MAGKIRIAQVAYDSEWALAKFFMAMFGDAVIKERFELAYITGLQKSEEEALDNLEKAVLDRFKELRASNSRGENKDHEIESVLRLTRNLNRSEVKYLQVIPNSTLPQEIYDNCDLVVIHSSNPYHIYFIADALRHGLPVICEKPLVPILDRGASPTRKGIERLEKLIDEYPGLLMVDAEHYSYKFPSVVFYENLSQLIGGAKIVSITGEILEKDDPFNRRTKEVLHPLNKTGLLGDTGVHLMSFVSNLGGKPIITSSEFDQYDGYSVDTYDKITFSIKGGSFSDEATGEFTVAKFIDKMVVPLQNESKRLELKLSDNSLVTIDFREKTIIKKDAGGRSVGFVSERPPHSNEYVNLLNNFYMAAVYQHSSITPFKNSLVSLEALYEAASFPSRKQINIYQNVV